MQSILYQASPREMSYDPEGVELPSYAAGAPGMGTTYKKLPRHARVTPGEPDPGFAITLREARYAASSYLRNQRLARDWTLSEAAAGSGVPYTRLSHLENPSDKHGHTHIPTAVEIRGLAAFYEMDPAELGAELKVEMDPRILMLEQELAELTAMKMETQARLRRIKERSDWGGS